MTTAAIRRFAVPSPDELIDRARAMVPEIRALAEETERNRNVLPHIIDKIRDAELLRTCRPKEFGGFEYDGETGAQDRDDDLGGLRLDRLGGQWCGLQRPLDRPLPDRGATRGLGRRRGPVHLRLLCADRHRRTGRWRLCAERHLVVCQRLRSCELGLSRCLYHPARCEAPHSRARSSYCRSAIARSSTIGLSAVSPGPAARTSSSARHSCRRTGYCCSPMRGRAPHPAPNIIRTRSTACRC